MNLPTLNTILLQAAPSWLEHSLHGNGKINVVVAVVGLIVLGLGLWMWRMDLRLKRMEEQQRK
jgi:type IV secretory pathway VirB2 component (pilin)